MSQIWFSSDPHYNHKNIVRGTSDWKEYKEGSSHQGVRDFDTLEEHNDTLVNNFNSKVKAEDTLWLLGDIAFGGHANIKVFMDRLICKNVHLVFGNHDQHIEKDNSPYKELFKSTQYYKEVKYAGKHFILSHFAMRVWNKSHHGSIMLYGHSHGTLDALKPEFANPTWIGDNYYIKNYKTMDVGVDTNNLFPYSLDDILKIMQDKEVVLAVDHHNENTN